MGALPVQRKDFKVDTRRPHSRTKLRAKIRHVLAVATGMFPLMALFVYGMSFLRLEPQRKPYYHLAIAFLACGMASLLFYAWARSEKHRRREISARNRELKYRAREDAFRREQAKMQANDPAPIRED